MNLPTQLMFLTLCVCAHSAPSPLRELHRHRSDYGVYASDYARDYEPYMYAAIPLHGPVPVLRILSRRPLTQDRNLAPSVPRPVYTRPPYQEIEYSPPVHNKYEYDSYEESPSYAESSYYPPSYEQQYVAPAVAATQDEVILYARPNPHGGFLYRRNPVKSSAKRSPTTTTTESPVIIRVHKYKIIKDR